ncbi:MAG: fumarylacetoacetate hydrolase family protein [Pseudomonadota bacterium]
MEKDLNPTARRLRDAYSTGPIAPMRDALDPTDIDGAYRVQAINTAHWIGEGRRLVGRKIGLTAKAVQAQLGVDQPDFGALFADMEIADGGFLDPARAIQPKAEAEIAFILGRDITDPEASVDEIAASIDHATAAIEIVDSRIADWKISFADTVADNGSSAFFVLGKERKPLAGLDLYTCGMVLEINGAIVSLGAGAACLGHPLNAVRWLSRALASRGEPLRAGDILLSGALGPMVTMTPGDTVVTRIGGLGACTFSYGASA